jgi:4-hydroxybenzoate polyprenyltransferase/phosphoserine phosphatase
MHLALIVDLDGTASRTDTLAESLLRLLAANPLALLTTLPTLRLGRAAYKQAIAAKIRLDPESLTYNEAVLDLARAARREGRPVFLVTGADQAIAHAVADHLQLFDGVFASDGVTNLTRHHKAALLAERFGSGGYSYIGDAAADVPVWRHAGAAILVAPRASLLRAARGVCANVTTLGEPLRGPALLATLRRALRMHQWAKNLLVFVPLLGAHRTQLVPVLHTLAAFLSFSLCASGVYLINDLVDLPHDRLHATKRRRPFAAGALDLRLGPLLCASCMLLSLSLALLLPWQFLLLLAGYFGTTLAYSLALKREMVVDVMILAGLYTLRIFAGGAATHTPVSPWLLAFSLFLFFCLAVVKRQTELAQLQKSHKSGRAQASGRGYVVEDLSMLQTLSAASGIAAVLVLALYVNSADVLPLYRTPEALWALCPILLFWISRVLMLSHRGQMHDDPVVFALRDRVSLLTGAATLIAVLAAT